MNASSPKMNRLVRISRGVVHAALCVTILASLFGYFAEVWWRFELFTHFPIQYAVIFMLLALGYLVTRHYRLCVVALCMLGLNLGSIVPLYFSTQVASDGEELDIVVFNLLRPNRRFDDVRKYLVESDADVILLLEVDDDWVREVDLEVVGYEIVAAEARSDTSGLVLYARPGLCDDAEIVTFGAEDEELPPVVRCTLEWEDHEVAFIGLHPSPPKTERGSQIRNFQLEEAGEWAARQQRPVVLVGDLNTTPFSPVFKELLARGRLLNSMQGYGYQWSWPVQYPFLAVPIDHCLHSSTLVTTQRHLGPGLGSDHKPLHVSLRHTKLQ